MVRLQWDSIDSRPISLLVRPEQVSDRHFYNARLEISLEYILTLFYLLLFGLIRLFRVGEFRFASFLVIIAFNNQFKRRQIYNSNTS